MIFSLRQVYADKVNHDVSCSLESNGFSDLVTALDSEKAAHEFILQPPIKAMDGHLVEFAEAMRSKPLLFYFILL